MLSNWNSQRSSAVVLHFVDKHNFKDYYKSNQVSSKIHLYLFIIII